MRVISQKGMPVMTDIPYEKATISQSMIEPNKIVAWDFFGGEDNIILMAEYSAPEKAEKAMQKLNDDYDLSKRFEAFGYKAVENMISWNGKKETMNCLSGNIFSFRFPKEDEI